MALQLGGILEKRDDCRRGSMNGRKNLEHERNASTRICTEAKAWELGVVDFESHLASRNEVFGAKSAAI